MLDNPHLDSRVTCFFNTIDNQAFASGMILANLIHEKESSSAQTALLQIKERLTDEQLNKLVTEYTQTSLNQKILFDPNTQSAFYQMFQYLLKTNSWAPKLNAETLFTLGEDLSLTRWALYRLMQQANPVQNSQIPVELFDSACIEQSFEAIAEAYQSFRHLPDHLEGFASNVAVAQILIKELSYHPQRFTLIEALIQKYPTLAPNVAQDWQQMIETNPLPQEQAVRLQEAAQRLGEHHQEFNALANIVRQPRVVQEDAQNAIKGSSYLTTIIGTSWTILNLPRLASLSNMAYVGMQGFWLGAPGPTAAAMAYSTCAVTIPLVAPLALYAGSKALWPSQSENINEEASSQNRPQDQLNR